MKRRLFISSVQREFSRERKLLKKFIEGNPILRRYFEVFVYEASVPARDKTTRQVYLAELRKSDVYLAIVGREYGFTDGEGRSPTEREFDEATRLGMTRLVFVEGGDGFVRDEKESLFLRKISKSLSWMRFDDGEGLLSGVYASLDEMIVADGRLTDLPFDAAFCQQATMSDVSRTKIKEFLYAARDKRGLSLPVSLRAEKVLEHFHLRNADTGSLTNSALLLFGKDPQQFFFTSSVKCVQWPTPERHKPIRDHRIVAGTLFEMADAAVQFVLDKLEKRIGSRAESTDATAPMTYDIPREVVTEAIVNAIAHRDYSSTGSVQVELFPDKLLVMSPGGPHPSVDVKKLAVAHPSFPVNPLLAEPLYQTGHIERMGTGLEDLFAACRRVGLPRPKLEVFAHEVHLTIFRKLPNKLPDKLPNKLPNKFPNKLPNKFPNKLPNKSSALTAEQLRLIKLIAKGPGAPAQTLAMRMGVSSRTIRAQVARLKKLGVLQRIGSNKSGHWRIAEGCEP